MKHHLIFFERAFSGLLDVIFVPDIQNWKFVSKISNDILPSLKLVTKHISITKTAQFLISRIYLFEILH